jgi:uncharacterized protein
MIKRIAIVLTLTCAIALPGAFAADQPPTEASIKQLLEVTQVRKLLESTMAEMDGFMQQAARQVTQGQKVTPEVQKQIDKGRAEAISMMKEILDWNKLEPMYVRIYQKSFNQQEIDSMVAMYKSPTGQMLLTKMPIVLQNTMSEMQQMLQPVMQRIQRMQQDVAAQMQAERAKKSG